MTDDELLSYAWHHSRTDRALFARGHVMRLYELAGYHRFDVHLPEGDFIAVRPSVVDPLIRLAHLCKASSGWTGHVD